MKKEIKIKNEPFITTIYILYAIVSIGIIVTLAYSI